MLHIERWVGILKHKKGDLGKMKTPLVTILFTVSLLLSNCGTPIETMVAATDTAQPTQTATAFQPSETPQPEPTKRPVFKPNVSYVPNGSKDQKLDLYLPKEGEGPFPTILAFHGGAFRSDPGAPDKSTYYPKFGRYFNELGYAFISADYRLAPQFSYPAQIEDVFCALAWVHANHETYDLDDKKLILMGDSTGGYLAAMLGTIETPEIYLENCPNKLPDSNWFQGTVIFYGLFDFTNASKDTGATFNEPYWGESLEEISPEKLAVMSPITWVDGSEPPFLLIHGTKDTELPSSMSEAFATTLSEAGVEVELLLVDFEHRFIEEPLANPANVISLEAIDAFLTKVTNK